MGSSRSNRIIIGFLILIVLSILPSDSKAMKIRDLGCILSLEWFDKTGIKHIYSEYVCKNNNKDRVNNKRERFNWQFEFVTNDDEETNPIIKKIHKALYEEENYSKEDLISFLSELKDPSLWLLPEGKSKSEAEDYSESILLRFKHYSGLYSNFTDWFNFSITQPSLTNLAIEISYFLDYIMIREPKAKALGMFFIKTLVYDKKWASEKARVTTIHINSKLLLNIEAYINSMSKKVGNDGIN